MEENKINIAAILKEKPQGTKLYSPYLGNVWFSQINERDSVSFKPSWGTGYAVRMDGIAFDGGEVMLFPSKQMRDWEKFAWKKGDVLDSNDGLTSCIFEGWANSTYTQFFSKYHHDDCAVHEDDAWQYQILCNTADYYKSNAPESFIELLEKHEGGKLNRETLTIERDVAKGLVGELCYLEGKGMCIVSMLEKINDDTFEFGDCVSWKDGEPGKKEYSIKFSEPVKKEDLTVLRRATKKEIYEYMVTKGRNTFKTFDKVLVRDEDSCCWEPAFFLYMNYDNIEYSYYCKSLEAESPESYKQCVPYKGCEHIAFTIDPF